MSNKDGRPVAFTSTSLNKAENNYPVIEKELLAIVWAVKHFRLYLYGKHFKIHTDLKPLIYLYNMKDPSSRLTKFRLALKEYNFEVEYIKGSDNVTADALSRISINELKDMNENIDNVMTRAQFRKNNEDLYIPVDSETLDDFPDQPKIVGATIKPKNSVELTFIDFNSYRNMK